MSVFKFGDSELHCKYLFSKDLLDLAASKGLALSSKIRNSEIDEFVVEFVCQNAIYGWSNVYDLKGKEIAFDLGLLYMIFEDSPELFIDVLRFCSRIDNFKADLK